MRNVVKINPAVSLRFVTSENYYRELHELLKIDALEGFGLVMILKMDVEGAEWGFLERVKPETLAQFGQMTFEIHNVIHPRLIERALKVLRKINETHQLIHLHANNNGDYVLAGGKVFSTLFEVSYVLRDKYKFSAEYDVKLPIGIDMPNIPSYPEIVLGHWNSPPEFDDRMHLITMQILQA